MAVKQDFEALYFKAAFCLTSDIISDFNPVSRTLGVDVTDGMGTVFTALGARYDMRYVAEEGFLTTDSYETDTRSIDKVPVAEVMRYTRGQTIREDAVPEKYGEFVKNVREGRSVFEDYKVYKAGEENASILYLISPAEKMPDRNAVAFTKLAKKAGKSVDATNEYGDCGYLMLQLELFEELEKTSAVLETVLDRYEEIVTDDQFVLDALLTRFGEKADKIHFVDEFLFENREKLDITVSGKTIGIHESGIINRLYPARKVDYSKLLEGAKLVYPARHGYDVSDSGIAGGLGLADEDVMKAVAARRAKDLCSLGADVILSPCSAEKAGLEAGGAEEVDSLLCYLAAL